MINILGLTFGTWYAPNQRGRLDLTCNNLDFQEDSVLLYHKMSVSSFAKIFSDAFMGRTLAHFAFPHTNGHRLAFTGFSDLWIISHACDLIVV